MPKYVQQAYIIDAVQMTQNNHNEVAAWLITHGADFRYCPKTNSFCIMDHEHEVRAHDDETIMILDGIFHVMYSAGFDKQYVKFLKSKIDF